MKSFFLLFAIAMYCAHLKAQAPANDNVCQAIQLTVSNTCTYQTFTTENATASTGSPAPNCANFVAGTTADVWFKATVPASGGLKFDTQQGAITNGGMALYRGNVCVALILLACDDTSSANGDMPSITATGLAAGSTVYVRFWGNGVNNNGTFGICVKEAVATPDNDEPCNATQLTIGATCTFQFFTNEGATSTTGVPAPVCANYSGGDVWFKVIVPDARELVFDSQVGDVTDGGMAVYSGADCSANLTLIGCDDNSSANGNMPSLHISNPSPGSTLWIRFWENGNDNNGIFGICVTHLQPPPPSNDEPCNAWELTVDNVCNYQSFTTEYATATQGVAAPGCSNYVGGDIWFKVTVPANGILYFDSQPSIMTDGGMAIYTGVDCSNLTLLACDDNSSANGNMPALYVQNQPPGSTLWVRFWENGGDNNNVFGICVRNLHPPSNDSVCNAIQLNIGANCNYQTFTTEDATDSPGVPIPSCANYRGGDVWFKVVVPAQGALFFDTQSDVITDGGMAVYTGTDCSNLSLLACDDDGSANGYMPAVIIGNQPPGSTVWVRFWEYGGDSPGTFGICVTVPALVANFTSSLNPVDTGTIVQFTDASISPGGFPIVSWQWRFAGMGGGTSTLQNPSHYYSTPGDHSVILTIKNTNNDSVTYYGAVSTFTAVPQIQQIILCPSIDSTQLSPVISGTVFQWQMSTDSITFTDIRNDTNFTGAYEPVLKLRNIPSSWYGRLFRCHSNDGYYTWPAAIKFTNYFTNAGSTTWENPANWSCGRLPDGNTDVIISGNVTLNSNASCRTLYVNPGSSLTISPGFTLTITH